MSDTAVAVLVILGSAYFLFALPVILQFGTYCDYVAKATGRQVERREFWNTDDGGMNRFEREQYGRLMRGDHMGITDPEIIALGRTLTSRLRHLPWMAVVLVVSVVATSLLVPAG